MQYSPPLQEADANMPSFETITLRTPRLLLRPLRESDGPALFGIHSDPRVARYLSRPPWTTIDQALELIANDQPAIAAGEYLRLGIEQTEAAALIGDCSLFNLAAESRRAELGYSLGADAWGNGYMVEALQALLSFAFKDLDLNRLEADIDPRNAASARTLQRLGFNREGRLRERWIVAGEVSDSDLYGLLRSDWQSAQTA